MVRLENAGEKGRTTIGITGQRNCRGVAITAKIRKEGTSFMIMNIASLKKFLQERIKAVGSKASAFGEAGHHHLRQGQDQRNLRRPPLHTLMSGIESVQILVSLRNLQQCDGSFMPTHIRGEEDLRFVYCADSLTMLDPLHVVVSKAMS